MPHFLQKTKKTLLKFSRNPNVRIKRKTGISLFLFSFIALLTACDIDRIIGAIHTEDRGGVFHGPILAPPETTCAACHGEALLGSPIAPSCYDCHGNVWSDLASITPPVPADGDLTGGDQPGEDLVGGDLIVADDPGQLPTPPEIGELPTPPVLEQPVAPTPDPAPPIIQPDPPVEPDVPVQPGPTPPIEVVPPAEPTPPVGIDLDGIHVISMNGVFHGRNFLTPETECVTCHGADLNGDPPAPSCRSCHGALWLFKGEPHTKIKDGVAHGKKLKKPEENCVGCHGDDLLGTPDAPSCLNCHGAIWDKDGNNTLNEDLGGIGADEGDQPINAPVNPNEDIAVLLSEVPHDKFKGGVGHAQDLKNAREACIGCHGADLQGGLTPLTPSCYSCHGEKWK